MKIFAMQGFGIVAAALVTIIVLAIFKQSVYENQNNLDYVWRLCIGLGAIPACIGIYFRLTIRETPRYSIKLEKDNQSESERNQENSLDSVIKQKNASFREFCKHFSKWKNLKVLLGTSITWFTLDVAFYGINLNTGIIIEAIGFAGII